MIMHCLYGLKVYIESNVEFFIFYELNTSVLEEIIVWIADLKGEGKNDKEES